MPPRARARVRAEARVSMRLAEFNFHRARACPSEFHACLSLPSGGLWPASGQVRPTLTASPARILQLVCVIKATMPGHDDADADADADDDDDDADDGVS
eukprot:193766-Rhodomonas_salina.1